jgi:hypothetical protein
LARTIDRTISSMFGAAGRSSPAALPGAGLRGGPWPLMPQVCLLLEEKSSPDRRCERQTFASEKDIG